MAVELATGRKYMTAIRFGCLSAPISSTPPAII